MTKEQRADYTNKWRAKRKEYALSTLGGKCFKCGSTNELDFDHIDRNTKITNIGRLWTASKSIFESELAKCQLLCKDCHKEKTKEYQDYAPNKYGEEVHNYKLTDSNIDTIRERLTKGDSQRSIARDLNVDRKLIYLVKENKRLKTSESRGLVNRACG